MKTNPGEWPNLWHLHAFQVTLSTGSLSAAAHELGLTQPALSQALAGLEAYFGSRLASRKRGRVVLTREGDLLAPRAERVIAFLCDGLRDVANMPPRQSIQLIRALSAARLSALTKIVRYGGFAEAARVSDVATPTLHRAARDLEKAIGVSLFEPTSYGVKPSRQARVFARYASLSFAEVRQAKAEIGALIGKGAGQTVIGAMPLARSHLVPIAAETLSREFPDHRIAIVEGAYDGLLAGLRRGDIDVLVGALRDDLALKDIKQETLFSDPLSIIMRANHPMAGEKRLTKAGMLKHPWIAPRAETPLRQQFDTLFFPGGSPADTIECNSLSAARVILMNSDRLMLLSDLQIRYEREAGMLTSVITPGRTLQRPIGVTSRIGWSPTQPQRRLLTVLHAEANKYQQALSDQT